MSKLTEGQENQIQEMRRDGKSLQEIANYFKETYDIRLALSEVSKAAKGARPKIPRGGSGVRKAHKAEKRKEPDEEEAIEDMVKEAVGLIGEIHAGYRKIIHHFRGELLRSRSEIRDILIKMGLDKEE